MDNISRMEAWILAFRPKTLPAAVAPVAVGTAFAWSHGKFSVLPALAAAAGSVLLQVAVNLANDYFDFKAGIDEGERLGPVRVTQAGLIEPEKVRLAMIVTLLLASFPGIYLISAGGWPVAAIGIAAILSALAYSGGPWPLASHGAADIFVFIFFGPVAVCGTYWVQALQLPGAVIAGSVPTGLLITAILMVNNLRDMKGDRSSGKNTLAVRLGQKKSRIFYALLVFTGYPIAVSMWPAGGLSPWVLLVLLSLPQAIGSTRSVFNDTGRTLNATLARTAKLSLVFSLLFSAGIMIR